jgi:hypothetical protein
MSELAEEPRDLEPDPFAGDSPSTSGPRRRLSLLSLPSSPFELSIAGLIVLGLAGRVAFYTSGFGDPDSDEAVGGLMAKDVLHGHPTTFMWGQAYGGPLETWLAAPITALFGPTWLGLRSVPMLLAAATSVVVWRVGLRTTGRTAALAAAALSWYFPSTLLWKTTHFHIFYASSTLLGMLTVLQVLRMWQVPSARGMFVLGLVAGVGIWQSFQLVTIIPTAIIWLVIRRRASTRLLPATLVGAALALVPALASNVRHGWWSRDLGHPGDSVPYLDRLETFFTNALPLAFDLRVPATLEWFVWKPLAVCVYGLVLVALTRLIWSTPFRGRSQASEVLLLIALVFPFIYALSPLTSLSLHPGYVIVLMPVLALLVCGWVRTEAQAILVLAVAVALLVHSIIGLGVVARQAGTEYPDSFYGSGVRLPRDFGPLISRLEQLGIRRVYASYWIAFRITYATDGRIVAADIRPEALRVTSEGAVIPLPDDPYYKSRHPGYAQLVSRVAAPAFVIDRGFDIASTDYGSFGRAHYQTDEVGPFTIYDHGPASRGTGTLPAP